RVVADLEAGEHASHPAGGRESREGLGRHQHLVAHAAGRQHHTVPALLHQGPFEERDHAASLPRSINALPEPGPASVTAADDTPPRPPRRRRWAPRAPRRRSAPAPGTAEAVPSWRSPRP